MMSIKYPVFKSRASVFVRVRPWLILLLLSSPAFGQISQEELRRERREIVEELRKTQDVSGGSNFIWRGLSNATGWEIDYGGWYAPTFTNGDNGTDRDASTQDLLDHTWEHDLRMFVRMTSATKKTNFYARLKTLWTGNSTGGANAASIRGTDWEQPTFDMFYLELVRLGRTFKHTWTFGRQYAQVERGISFGLVADGIRYEMASRRNEVQVLLLRQQPGDDNIDATAGGWNPGRTKRLFYGAEWKLKYHPKHKLGIFALSNTDRNFEFADAAGQRHLLDSLYYGIGFDGTMPFLSRLNYWFQYIQADGTTYPNGAGSTTIDLNASAMDIGLRYFFPTALSPTIYWEYAAGSGDGDATGSATGTAGGSTAGDDGRFISFGGLSLGYALAPQLVNLNVNKFGFSVKPFGWSASRLWSELVVQPTYYTYSKDKSAGATSDPVANVTSSKIGDEIDVTIAWRLAGDLKYQFKWGRFSPGAAYATRSAENYLRLKVSLDL